MALAGATDWGTSRCRTQSLVGGYALHRVHLPIATALAAARHAVCSARTVDLRGRTIGRLTGVRAIVAQAICVLVPLVIVAAILLCAALATSGDIAAWPRKDFWQRPLKARSGVRIPQPVMTASESASCAAANSGYHTVTRLRKYVCNFRWINLSKERGQNQRKDFFEHPAPARVLCQVVCQMPGWHSTLAGAVLCQGRPFQLGTPLR